MKRTRKNFDFAPLSKDAEGKLRGGFAGIHSDFSNSASSDSTNYNCYRQVITLGEKVSASTETNINCKSACKCNSTVTPHLNTNPLVNKSC